MASFLSVAQSETIAKKAKLYTLNEIVAAQARGELFSVLTVFCVYDGTSVKYPFQTTSDLSADGFIPLFYCYYTAIDSNIYVYEGIPVVEIELVESFTSSFSGTRDYSSRFPYYIEACGGYGSSGNRGSNGGRSNSYTSSANIMGGNGGAGGGGGVAYSFASVYWPNPVNGEHISRLFAIGGNAGGGGGGGAGGKGATASSDAGSGGAGGAGGAGYKGEVRSLDAHLLGTFKVSVGFSPPTYAKSGSDGKGYETYGNGTYNYSGGAGGASSDGNAGISGTKGSGGAGGAGGSANSLVTYTSILYGTLEGYETSGNCYVKVYKYVPVGIQ